ncbi:single-strand binding family protein [Sutterella sp. KLE1602]|jgi:single-strand DNA-binding protein|uniref:single-stranded DNA-binding protein n=1 Tax=Sutterella sp. KLE1602 TaxID=1574262 RepID=UPI0007862D86|nr:single-stranded DNA-binding protein [Sutterella sp. KLE1602]KXT37617.1 single-strand binding family protein [Sutterella sp. KLE1602]
MASVNKVIILGNVGQDPEIRQGNFIVAALSIATTRKWRDKAGETQSETEWHRVSAFGRLAEIISQYVRKGDPIYIEGRLRTRKYEDKQGVERWVTEIIAEQLQLLRQKDSDEKPAQAKPAAQRRAPESTYDSDVPF